METLIELGKLLGQGVVVYAVLDRRLTRLETLVELVVKDKIKKGTE